MEIARLLYPMTYAGMPLTRRAMVEAVCQTPASTRPVAHYFWEIDMKKHLYELEFLRRDGQPYKRRRFQSLSRSISLCRVRWWRDLYAPSRHVRIVEFTESGVVE